MPTSSVNQEDVKIDSSKEDIQPNAIQNEFTESPLRSNEKEKLQDKEIINIPITENKEVPTPHATEEKIDPLDFEKEDLPGLTT